MIALTWVSAAWIVSKERTTLTDNRIHTANEASAFFSEHIQPVFRYSDSYIDSARNLFVSGGVAAVREFFDIFPPDASIISHVTVIGADGVPQIISAFPIKPGTHARDRAYFKFQRDNPGDVAYVTRPITGRNSGITTVRLVRRIETADGQFGGVVFAAIKVGALLNILPVLNIGSTGALTVVGTDRNVRATSEPDVEKFQSSLETSPLWDALAESPMGMFSEHTDSTGHPTEYVTYSKLEGLPLVAMVKISSADIEASLASTKTFANSIAAVITLLVLSALYFVARQRATQIVLQNELRERRTIEHALSDTQERYRQITDTVPVGIIVHRDWNIAYVNPAAVQMFGAGAAKDLIGRDVREFIKAEDRATIPSSGEAKKRSGDQVDTSRVRRVRLDGTEFWSEGYGRNIMYEGEPARLALFRDISQQVEAEQQLEAASEQLRLSHEQYRSLTELSPDAVFVHANGKIVFANQSMADLMEADSIDELIGMEALKIVHPDHLERVKQRRTDIYDQQKLGFRVGQYLTVKGNTVDVDASASLTTWDGQDAILIVGRDITERMRLEQQLRQSQKMEAVGQLTGGVAHDFNNLLAIIQGNAELLALSNASKSDTLVDPILRASRRGSELTQRLLAFSRRQSLQPETIAMAALVTGMHDLLRRTLGETIEIEMTAAGELWPVLADSGQVENALLNLAINARDAMPDGGKLTIECANAVIDQDYVDDHPYVETGEYVVLAVSDNGTGMGEEVQSHAFEPFFTTKEVSQGSGLGLSMIYGFAHQSGGFVNIYSEEGHGTTVRLYLPRASGSVPAEPEQQEVKIPRGDGETVLLIEDEEEVRMLAERMLRSLGYTVIAVGEAADARTVLDSGQEVDIVLSDVVLSGGISGPQFADEVRDRFPEIPIVFMSGYPAEAATRNGFIGSDSVLLNKPFQRIQLAEALRGALQTKDK